MSYFTLFCMFAKFALLSIGGGYVIIPLLYQSLVSDLAIFSSVEFGNLISLSQVIPGATSINTAIYVGFTQKNITGAIVASLGFVVPQLVITTSAISVLKKFEHSRFAQGLLKGARLSAFVMILYSIPLFLNMSVFSCAWPVKDIIHTIIKRTLIIPSEFSFNVLEFFVFILCFIFIKKGMSATKFLILSAVIGYSASLIKHYI